MGRSCIAGLHAGTVIRDLPKGCPVVRLNLDYTDEALADARFVSSSAALLLPAGDGTERGLLSFATPHRG